MEKRGDYARGFCSIPEGSKRGGGRFIRPRLRGPEVALRLPPANGCDPFGIEEGEEDDLSDRGYTDRRWRCAYRDPVVALRLP
jgi:hypothetical protein